MIFLGGRGGPGWGLRVERAGREVFWPGSRRPSVGELGHGGCGRRSGPGRDSVNGGTVGIASVFQVFSMKMLPSRRG